MLAACSGSRAAPAPVPPLPVDLPCALAADAGRAYGFREALDRRLERDRDGALFAEGHPPGDGAVRTIVTCPDAPFLVGTGMFVDLAVGADVLRGAYADWSDGWRIHLTPPRDLFANLQVADTRAEVWLSIARRWATIDVSLDAVTSGDDRRLVLAAPPLEAPVTDPDAPIHDGFRLVGATVDGAPADIVLGAGGYLVIGGLPAGLAHVALRYEGPLPLVGDNQAEARVLELHRWLPSVPYTDPRPLAITIHHPAEDTLVASLPTDARADDPALAGWTVEHARGLVDRDPSLLLLDRAPAVDSWDDHHGSRITMLAAPAIPSDGCAPALDGIVRALAPLGPVGDVRLLAAPSVFGRHGRRAGDLVVILREKLVDLCTTADPRRHALAVELVTHELAHGWFGRDVRAVDDEASAWWEAAAEYVSSWAVDDAAANELRHGWLDDYDDQEERDHVAMAARVPTTAELHDALSYDKGALLFTALEARIGRPRVVAVLRELIARRRGGLGSWLDVVAAVHDVAGSEASTWLHGWLFTPGAPRLTVSAVRSGDRATVTITSTPPFVVTVELVALAGDPARAAGAGRHEPPARPREPPSAAPRMLGEWAVPLAGTRNTVTIELPPEADQLVVDPFARMPRYGLPTFTLTVARAGGARSRTRRRRARFLGRRDPAQRRGGRGSR